jgi:nucleoside-diphosphate-sugar epimerase
MNIFITGGTGFLGRYTVRELRKRGYRLLVMSRGEHREPGVEYITGDLSNIASLRPTLEHFKPEVAIHLAWEGIPDFSAARCVKNLHDGLNLFLLLSEMGCKKIIAIGSCFEYGNVLGEVKEDHYIEPYNPFSAAKHSLHIMGQQITKEHGVNFVWLRPFYIYGPGQRPASLIPSLIASAKSHTPLALKTPQAQNDFVYVGDVAEAIADAIENIGQDATYNIASGKLTSLKKITEIIYTELRGQAGWNEVMPLFQGEAVGGFYANLVLTHQDLHWQPKTNIEVGIRNMIYGYI